MYGTRVPYTESVLKPGVHRGRYGERTGRPRTVLAAERAGLTVTGVREFRGRMEFGDVAAVVHFLRKVIWIVPGFTTDAYRDRLRALHERIRSGGPFTATTVRFLIEAKK